MQPTRYNRCIPHMQSHVASGMRLGWLTSFVATVFFLSPSLFASTFTDAARQLAHKISAATGPGAIALEIVNRSSLDERSVAEVRSALESQLRADGVRTAKPDESVGSVSVTLSESVREYVWTAEIILGQDERRIALVSLPRPQRGGAPSATMPLLLRKTFLFTQELPILDATSLDISGSPRLLVLDAEKLAVYHQQNGRWELESSLPVMHTRTFPRDLRGRILLRRDHLFDIHLPGVICRSSTSAPLALACNDSDDPWPLTTDETGPRAFFTPARNFFTGAFSPPIGKIANGPSFYSAAALPRSGYTLWILAGVDGSIHLLDGMTDQVLRNLRWGSDLAAVHSACGTGTQLLVSETGDPAQDSLRAFEVPDRDPVASSAPVEFDGTIVSVWPEGSGTTAIAIVKREDTGWYEAYRISVACGS